MESSALTCPVCYNEYDLNERTPRIIPACGHSLCSKCITVFIKNESHAKCPLDKIAFPQKAMLESFHMNFALKQLLEDMQSFGLCPQHNERLRLVCLNDKSQVCDDCAHFGDHKGHDVKTIKQAQSEIYEKRRELEKIQTRVQRYNKEIDHFLDDTKTLFKDIIKNKVEEIKWLLSLKETELLTDVDSFFNQQKKHINDILELESNFQDSIASKISSYQGPIKFPDRFDLIEEDISLFTSKFSSEALNNFMKKLLKNVKEVASSFNHSLNSQIIHLAQTNFPTQNLAKAFNVHLNEHKDDSIPEKASNGCLFKINTVLKLKVAEEWLEITTGDKEPEEAELDPIQWRELKNIRLNIINKQGLNSDDHNALFYIWRNLKSVSSFEMICNSQGLLDKSLLDIFSILFWRTSELRSFKMDVSKCRVGDESISFFMKKILPKLNGVQNLDLRFWKTTITNETIVNFSKNNHYILKSLDSFNLSLRETRVTDESVAQLFMIMPHIKHLVLNFMETSIGDKTIESFVKNSLHNMKNLETFKLYLGGTKVSDASITTVFSSISNVKEFLLDLGNTKVSDKTAEAFRKSHLVTDNILENFELRIYSTNITEEGVFHICIPLENAKRLVLHLGMIDLTDLCLHKIVKYMLSFMKNLENFEIRLFHTKVTDSGILHLLRGLLNVNEFYLDLEYTRVTDQLCKEFIEKVLPEMKVLKRFDMRLACTQVTEKAISNLAEAREKLMNKT